MRKTRLLIPVYALLAMTTVAVLWAGAEARFRGEVVDSQGEPVPGATIVLTSEEATDYRKEVEVRDDGTFVGLILDATRNYTMRVEAEGYVPWETPFKLGVGSTDRDNTFRIELKTEAEMRGQERESILAQPGFKELTEAMEALTAGDKATARTKLEAAVAAKPDLVAAREWLAQILLEDGETEAAQSQVDTCLELDDESLKCLAVGIETARALGNSEREAELVKTYSELNPEDPALLLQQAAKLLAPDTMDDESARPLLERCLQADPDYPECLYELGNLLLRAGDIDGAKTKLQRYITVAPDAPNAAAAKDIISYL